MFVLVLILHVQLTAYSLTSYRRLTANSVKPTHVCVTNVSIAFDNIDIDIWN